MRRRFQFSLTWLAIAALVIGAFFGGVTTGRRCHEIENERQLHVIEAEKAALALKKTLNRPTRLLGLIPHQKVPGEVYSELIRLPDGSEWEPDVAENISRRWGAYAPVLFRRTLSTASRRLSNTGIAHYRSSSGRAIADRFW